MKIEIYTDGSCSRNGMKDAIAGWGWCLLVNGENIAEDAGVIFGGTNNQGELQGIIAALEFVKENAKNLEYLITVYSDSSYCIKGITEWIYNWKRNGWFRNAQGTSELKNREYWQLLDNLASHMNIEWVWVKGHADNYWNNYVDKLATNIIKE